MCGIFGAFNFQPSPLSAKTIQAMSHSIRHRGPDADGYFTDDTATLGNRRLAILDLSEASNQPLYSDDKSIVIVQNGEIYNYIELRSELKKLGANFATSGDTEVVLRAFETWGPNFVSRLNGMFSIAIYLPKKQEMLLYRDRLGVKPLFMSGSFEQGRVWFGSEIKAILASGQKFDYDLEAISQFLALNYIPPPKTAFKGIVHLQPGHMARLSKHGIKLEKYWDLTAIAPEKSLSSEDAKKGIMDLLDDATRIRMRSDAAFGAFLSGGLDSSTIVGLMARHSTEKIHSFSIGFEDPRFDETYFAKLASARFDSVHIAKKVEPDAVNGWPRFIYHCDQPHGDVSFMPMDTVSKLAAFDVKMVLTGDGGDELFAGYEKYLKMFPRGKTDNLAIEWQDQVVRDSGLLQDDEPQNLLKGALKDAFFDNDPYAPLSNAMRNADHQDPINQVLLAETSVLLPGNNLVKPDRMAMANSLEIRSPFLDYRLAEFAFKIPGAMKLADGETKSILKTAVEPLIGRELAYREKQMFTVPVGEWFRNALATFCKEMLLCGRLEARNLFEISFIEQMLTTHISGSKNYTRQLRAIISLEIWFRIFVDQDTTTFVAEGK